MFESLSEKLSGIFDKLTGRGVLSEDDVNAAMRQVRLALLEADVALEVVRSFVDKARTKAVGAALVKSIKPGQMVVKIVHDALVETLGGESQAIDLNAPAPVGIMLVGLPVMEALRAASASQNCWYELMAAITLEIWSRVSASNSNTPSSMPL